MRRETSFSRLGLRGRTGLALLGQAQELAARAPVGATVRPGLL
ncbi:hypothetical protein [Streptomyces sp. NBC_01190]|nr:hypothetical protein OG519_30185 [Streptomyces sp. NBC_01190]